MTLRRGSYVVEVAALFDLEDSPSPQYSLLYEGVGIIRPLELQSGDADITELVAAPNIYTADVRFDTDSVTVAAVANHASARVVVSPDDAAPDADGHQVALAAPADGESSARTVVSAAVTAQDGTRDTYAVVITRPAAVPAAQITMELPEGCVLHDVGPGTVTARQRWDDDCDSLHNTDPQRAAQYYRLYIGRDSNVRLIVRGDSSSDLLIRSTDGTIVAQDLKDTPHFHYGELFVALSRGVYVVEVAAHWYHFGHRGHRLYYQGEGIIGSYGGYWLDGLAISDVGLTGFDPGTTTYARNVAADVSEVTVTSVPAFADSVVDINPPDADLIADGHQVTLEADDSTDISVTVSSRTFPTLTTTYTVTLNGLAGTTAPLSNDATLSALSLSDIDIGTFASDDYRYSYTLGFYQSLNGHTTTVSPPTTTHSGATSTVSPRDADTGTAEHQVKVNGDDTIKVTVTSQDGDIRRTYTVSPGPPASRADSSNNVCTPCRFNDARRHRDLWVNGDQVMVALSGPNSFAVFDRQTGRGVETFTIWSPQIAPRPESPLGWKPAGGVIYDEQNRPEQGISSFWTDGETLWVIFSEGTTVYAYSYATKERLPEKDIPNPFSGGIVWSSIWSDGTTMYVLNTVNVSAIDIVSKQHLRTVRLEGRRLGYKHSIWSDGGTLWVTDEASDGVKAYNLMTGARLLGLDLPTGRTNGMWSDGATIWIFRNRGIYGYTLPENARLKQLSLDVGDIGLFNNGIFGYEATVPAGTTEVTVTAAAAFTGGSSNVAFNSTDADAGTDGHQVSITAATTTVTITVTAPNGTDTETYTVTITRAP